MVEEAKKFGARLRELRTRSGMTQRELAERVNVDFTYLSKIENGVMPPPSEKVILQLAASLNTDKDELLTLAGKIPPDIAQMLKERETLQLLRSEHVQKKVRAASRKGDGLQLIRKVKSMPKVSIPLKGLYRVAIPIVLVIAVAASLWYAAPTRALQIAIAPPAAGTFGSTHTFTVEISIEDSELLPVDNIVVTIYKSDDRTNYKATLASMPLGDSSESAHTITEGSASGSVTVAADADSKWDYFYGTGNVTWEDAGYTFTPSQGYGYGYQSGATGTTSITYTVTWTSPSGWPAGDYKVEAKITAPDNQTFTQTSSAFALSVSASGDGDDNIIGGGGAAPDEVTADDIADLSAGDAADELEGVEAGEAADLIEELIDEETWDAGTAADVFDDLATDEAGVGAAADIIEEIATDTAADIIEEVATGTAAAIIEAVTTETATAIIEEVTTGAAADILEEVNADAAAAIMEGLTTGTLEATIPAMSPTALTDRLPGLTAGTLHSINPEVLFGALPDTPTETLTGEVTPEALEGLDLPDVVRVTSDGEEYLAIRTGADGWVIIAATPAPIDQLMIKTNKALANVKTTVRVIAERPLDVLIDLPDEKIVRTYIEVTFENIVPDEDIDVGHMGFYVEKDWLEQNSIHKWSVALNRYDPDLNKWIALPTKRVSDDDTTIHYSAVISRFTSSYAITGSETAPTATFRAANLTISPAKTNTGEIITISADITNLTDATLTDVITLWINNTIEKGKDISIKANETESVSFTVTRAAEGTYNVRLDRLFGSFNVTKAPAPAPTPPAPAPAPAPTPAPAPAPTPPAPSPAPAPTPSPAPAPTPVNWWLIGGIIGAVIVIGVIVWLLVARRRD
ncbi:PGF-pre-PGF domain-containing protein [Chloroflexota bacterium]